MKCIAGTEILDGQRWRYIPYFAATTWFLGNRIQFRSQFEGRTFDQTRKHFSVCTNIGLIAHTIGFVQDINLSDIWDINSVGEYS
jgi:hypothetical protein